MSKKKSPANAPRSSVARPLATDTRPWYVKNWFWLSLAGLLAAVWGAFGAAAAHDFVSWDDHVYVYENPLILQPTAEHFRALGTRVVSLNYHPLTMWSLWLNAALWGPDARSFIVTNILIHWLNAGLLCWLVWLLTDRRFRSVAFLSALLFAIHPLRAESVVWVSERKDVLYVFFFLSGCIIYWQYLESQRKSKLWLALLCMLLACLSKGVAVVFPLVCLLLDYWKKRDFSLRWLAEKIPMFALSLLFGLIALDVQKGGDFHGWLTLEGEKVKALASVFSLDQKFLFAGYGYAMYFLKTFVPLDLCTFYPYPTEAGLRSGAYTGGLIFMMAGIALALWSARRTRLFVFGFGWVLSSVMLVLQLISVGVVIMADRYFYLPSAGVFFMLTFGVERFVLQNRAPLYRQIWWGVLVVFALWCLTLSRAQTATWKNSETLWKQVLRFYPDEDQALETLANWYGKENRVPEAEQLLEHAIKDGSTRPNVYSTLANCVAIRANASKDTATQRSLRDRAFSLYAQSIALNPKNADTYFNRAFTALTVYPERAVADLDSAILLAPYKALTFKQMKATALNNLKRYDAAEQTLNEVIAAMEAAPQTMKNPEEKNRLSDAYLERGLARFNNNRRAEGIADAQKSLGLAPQNQRAAGLLEQMRKIAGQ
jgi:tetratricopeptide (TPR) repeat protein